MRAATITLPTRMPTAVLAAVLCTAVLFAAIAAPARAQDQPPFDEAELERCIRDTPALVEYIQSEHGEAMAEGQDADAVQQMAMQQSAKAWLAERGWEQQRYAYVLDHMSRGYVALRMRREEPTLNAEMQAAMNDPAMTEAMREQMRQAMAQMRQYQEAEGVTPAEMLLIEARMDDIEGMYERLE